MNLIGKKDGPSGFYTFVNTIGHNFNRNNLRLNF